MTRKDSEKDVDRPRYYSQFWLDIAAGRRVIGGPRPEDEAGEAGEAELLEPEPEPIPPTRKAGRNSTANGYKETRAAAVVAPIVDEEEEEESVESLESEEEDLVDEAEIPNIVLNEAPPKVEEPKVEEPTDGEPTEEGEEEFFDEEEEENDEEWGARGGRKKAKPVRAVKPVKKPKPRR
ncbi:MAG: hypothetical protein ABI234_06855 [Ktedonobacteraceae bacterium]